MCSNEGFLNDCICPAILFFCNLQLAQEIFSQAKEFDLDFIQISCHSLATSVRDEALGWVKATSKAMRDIDMVKMQSVKDNIQLLTEGIQKTPDSLNDLKDVLNTVNTIRMSGAQTWKQSRPQNSMYIMYKLVHT